MAGKALGEANGRGPEGKIVCPLVVKVAVLTQAASFEQAPPPIVVVAASPLRSAGSAR